MFGLLRATQPAPDDEAKRLRDALVLVLQHASANANPAARKRADKVLARLGQGPSPTGLLRELGELLPDLDAGAGDGGCFAKVTSELVDAMGAVAVEDRELTHTIQDLAIAVPRTVDRAACSGLSSRARSLKAMGAIVQERAAQARAATVALVQTLVAGIAKASGSTGRVDALSEALARSVVELNDVDGMSELARRMQGHLDGLRLEVTCLQRDLETATYAVANLGARLNPPSPDGDFEDSLRAHLERAARS